MRTLTVTVNGHQVDVTVPAGHLHASEVQSRGWTADLIKSLLKEHAVLVEGVSSQVSPKAYPADVVERLESEHPTEFAAACALTAKAREGHAVAAAAAAQVMPRLDPGHYTHENTVGRGWLKARGWTDSHITRLLGAPDFQVRGAYGMQHLWGRERAAQAESTDVRLQKRLAQVQATQAAEKAAGIEASLAVGRAVFRKDGDAWRLVGRGLKAGDTVEAALRDGRTVTKRVGLILATDENGLVTATVADERRAVSTPQPRITRRSTGDTPPAAPVAHPRRPEGHPALPAGERRNLHPDSCARCDQHVPAGGGTLTMGTPSPDDSRYDTEDLVWRVTCPVCTWIQWYRLPADADPMPWVALGWTVDQVLLALRAGVTADEAAGMDPTDESTVASWRTMAALR